MSITYGFYNSKDGDRRYDAVQMSSIFDGIIRDGVFQSIGTAMMVKASEGMTVNVGIGRAWFNHTWTLNDSLLPLTISQSEVLLDRCDAVILEVDSREHKRANDIKIIKGVPSSNPVRPNMIKTNDVWQYPLAYIHVAAGATAISQSDILNCVGTDECPFITAPLEKVSIDDLLSQWGTEWREWKDVEKNLWRDWGNIEKNKWQEWMNVEKDKFEKWYSSLNQLVNGGDISRLANQIIQNETITTITLHADSWTNNFPYMQTVSIPGVTDDSNALLLKDDLSNLPSNTLKLYNRNFGYIYAGKISNDTITIYARLKPMITFDIRLKGLVRS